MKYLFILGRNVELSIAELKAFFEKERIHYNIISKISNAVMIEFEKPIKIPVLTSCRDAGIVKNPQEVSIIERLGGTISIGEVLAEGKPEKIFKELDKKELYEGASNKLNYVVFDFRGKNTVDVLLYLKQRFRKEQLKATEKKLTGNIKLQSGEIVNSLSSHLVQEQYFVFDDCFGRMIESCDYEKIEQRDMKKPVRRESLSISPRLAKILVNLSGARENETLLDPFCGIGTVLQEALLQNINVIGVDKDKQAIEDAKTNLEWFKFPKSDYILINEDSSKVKVRDVKGIATEPDLGELQKRIPSEQKAKEILAGFELLMIKVLNNLKPKVHGKIAFTSPLIQTDKKKIVCDFENIAKKTGLKIAKGFPISEFREDSIVGRSILVMGN
jgi:tRNA G10  N-methylase Trm11